MLLGVGPATRLLLQWRSRGPRLAASHARGAFTPGIAVVPRAGLACADIELPMAPQFRTFPRTRVFAEQFSQGSGLKAQLDCLLHTVPSAEKKIP